MQSHFDRGFEAGKEHEEISIALNNTWGGRTKSGGHTSSYEKIGYHAGSVEFLDGVLASGCPVKKYAKMNGKLIHFQVTQNLWRPTVSFYSHREGKKVLGRLGRRFESEYAVPLTEVNYGNGYTALLKDDEFEEVLGC